MFVLITVAALYYDDPLLTFPTHRAAYLHALHNLHGAWFDIERVG